MRRWALLFAFALLLLGSLYVLARCVKDYQLGNEIGLPLLAIAGVMALIGSLALVAIGFSMMNMSDRTQPLGLPNGSVRAVIALSLVVLFAILTVYLFSALNSSSLTRVASCLTQDTKEQLIRTLQPIQLIGSVQNPRTESGEPCNPEPASNAAAATSTVASPAAAPAGTVPAAPSTGATAPPAHPDASKTNGGATAPEQFYTVYFRDAANLASEDFAKQLLVLIGTLMTAVSAFYFGSKATADAQDGVGRSDPPNLIGVDPAFVIPGGPGAVAVKITGNNLNSVTQAQIASGAMQISDANVVSNSGQVLAHFNIPAAAPIGPWDVIVTDSAGRQAKLAGALTMREQTASPPAAGLAMIEVAPNAIPRGGLSTLAITGTELAQVEKAEIKVGATRITGAQVVAFGSSQFSAQFSVPPDAPLGHWDVTVTDKTGRSATLTDKLTVTEAKPVLTDITPKQATRPANLWLNLSGTHLDQIVKVKIKSGADEIDGTDVLSGPTTVKATFTIPAGKPTGPWDIIATDKNNRSETLSGGLMVS